MDLYDRKDLKTLIEEAGRGDMQSFRVVFDQFNDKLFAYALSRTSSRADALDMVQETFVELWKAIPKFNYRSDEEFLGFIFKLMRRRLSRHYGSLRKDVSIDDAEISASYEIEIEDYRYLEKRMDTLGRQHREILRLRYWAGMSFGEIASVLGAKEGTVKVHHHRAIKKLKEEMENNI